MATATQKPRRVRYTALAAAAFAISYIGAMWISTADLAGAVKAAAALTAAVVFAIFLVTEIRLIRGLDELQRLVQLEALAVAFPLSLALVMFLGLVQRFAELPVDDLSYRHVWPVMALFYVAGVAIASRRYR